MLPNKLLALMLMLPGVAGAASWSIHFQTGVLKNSGRNEGSRYEQAGPFKAYFSVGAGYRYHGWEYGLRAGYRPFAFRQSGVAQTGVDPSTQKPVYGNVEVTEKLPALALSPYIRWYIPTGRLSAYIGASIGYVQFFGSSGYSLGSEMRYTYEDGAAGLSLEAQMGASYKLRDRLSLFNEESLSTINMPNAGNERTNMTVFASSFGIRLVLRQNRN